LGKIDLSIPYERLFPEAVEINGFDILQPDFIHWRELLNLPFHHRDPFDRLLIAQAISEGMILASCDPHVRAYGVQVLW
jgi:PIN domain nuclease of toxin-antitoxin system